MVLDPSDRPVSDRLLWAGDQPARRRVKGRPDDRCLAVWAVFLVGYALGLYPAENLRRWFLRNAN